MTMGPGVGGGGAGGLSFTHLTPLNYSTSNTGTSGYPPPGGTTEIDPSICPDCATAERVTVTGTDPNAYGSAQSYGYVGSGIAGGMYSYPGASQIPGSTMQPTGFQLSLGGINGMSVGAWGSNVPAAAEDGVYWSMTFQGFR